MIKKYIVYFFYINPISWREDIERLRPDFMLFESAWFGNEGVWANKVSTDNEVLVEITKACRRLNIPSIFWCKEDPVHFHRFLLSASHFDFIFTNCFVFANPFNPKTCIYCIFAVR